MRVAITGANGFVGRGVLNAANEAGWETIAIVRRTPDTPIAATDPRFIKDPWLPSAWAGAAEGADAVVHLIGHAHDLDPASAWAAYRHVNVDVTDALLQGLSGAGLKRFVYMSSVKAVTEATATEPVTASTNPAPTTAYGESKLMAENLIADWAHRHGIGVVILRPPLVYGPGVKGNMRQLIRLADTPLPLPMGGIHNARSLISIDNLADAVIAALQAEESGAIRLPLSDPEPISTSELIRRLRHHLNRPTRLLGMPSSWLRAVARPTGKAHQISKLTENLEISNTDAEAALDWTPTQSTSEGLARMVESYRATGGWRETQPSE